MPANERTPLLRDVEQLAGQVKPDLLHIAKVIGALQAGKLPTQAQVNQAIDALTSTRSSFISPDRRRGEGKLSEGGRLILQDTRDILIKLQKWLDAKNKGDVIQELLYNTSKASLDIDADADIDIKKPASSKEVKKDANDISETLRTLASLVLDQAKILKRDATKEGSGILGDLILVSRDLLADAAEEVSALADEAAKEIRPTEGEEGKVPSKEDIKQKGKQAQDKAKEKASEAQSRLEKEASPAQDKALEAKDKAVDRLVSVAQRIQKDPAYKKAFDQLYSLARKYYKKTGEAIEATAESANVDGDVYGNEHTQRAIKAFKQLLENLADGKSVDPVIEKANKVFEDIKSDERLSKYVDDVEKYLKTLLEDPDYAASKAPRRDAGKLYDRGQELLQSNAEWKEDANALLQELEAFGKAIADDKQGKAVADAVAKLGTDLAGTAKVGAKMFKGKAGAFYRDIVNVLVPRALALLREIPIPRTEYKSRDIEFVIDNFTITSASFVPDNLVITNHSEFAARDIGKAHGGANVESSTRVRFDGLRFTAKDVSFWVRRPGAILLAEERGLLDLALTGAGLSGDLTLALSDEDDEESYFKVTKSSVSLKNLSLSIHDNYHYILSFIFGPILNAAVKVSLEHALSAQISDSFEMLDWRAFDIRRRAVRYQSQGYGGSQAYARALTEPSPASSSGPSFFAGLHSTSRGFIRDDRGPHDAQLAIGGQQLLPGKSGPKPSIEQAKKRAAQLANEVDRETGASKKANQVANQAKKANVPKDADQAKKQADQMRNIVRDEFEDAEEAAEEQRRREAGDEGWKSNVFDL